MHTDFPTAQHIHQKSLHTHISDSTRANYPGRSNHRATKRDSIIYGLIYTYTYAGVALSPRGSQATAHRVTLIIYNNNTRIIYAHEHNIYIPTLQLYLLSFCFSAENNNLNCPGDKFYRGPRAPVILILPRGLKSPQ